MSDGQVSPLQQLSERLDQEYYERSPAEHFRTRAEMISAFADGVTAGAPAGDFTRDVLSRLPEWHAEEHEPGESEAARLAVTVEAFMLAHHAAESLLRQFLAHLDARPAAPVWFLMSVRDRTFRKRVTHLRDSATDEDLRSAVTRGLLGDRATADVEAGAEAVTARIEHAVNWLRQAANLHLEAGTGYNAAKHGLSALPTTRHISFVRSDAETGAPQGRPIELFAGAALLSLESEGKAPDRRWFQVARLVDSPGLVAMTLVLADLMDSLWQIGRARQLREPAAVSLISSPSFGDLITGRTREWGEIRMPLVRPPSGSSLVTEAVLQHLAQYSDDIDDEEQEVAELGGDPGLT